MNTGTALCDVSAHCSPFRERHFEDEEAAGSTYPGCHRPPPRQRRVVAGNYWNAQSISITPRKLSSLAIFSIITGVRQLCNCQLRRKQAGWRNSSWALLAIVYNTWCVCTWQTVVADQTLPVVSRVVIHFANRTCSASEHLYKNDSCVISRSRSSTQHTLSIAPRVFY